MPTLQTLDADAVDQGRELIASLLAELHPTIDTRSGGIRDVIIKPLGTLQAFRRTEIEEDRYRLSLKLARENPDIVSDDQVDDLMVDYLYTRKLGSAATGTVLVVVSSAVTVTVPAGGIFDANGRQFQAVSAFLGIPPGKPVLGEFERQMTLRADGNYSFPIQVVCTEDGPAGRLTKDSLLTPTFVILAFAKAYAAADFADGEVTESNAELLQRQAGGLAAKTASNRLCNAAVLRDQPAFADILAVSIIGYGDAEMRRDTHSLFPFSFGGRTDWYVRTARLPTRTGVKLVATLIEDTRDGYGIWQFSLDRDAFPGFYDVPRILPEDADEDSTAGSYPIVSDVRPLDRTQEYELLSPDIITSAEGMFTRYQTGTIRFRDTDTPIAALTVGTATKTYAVTVRHMPLILELQQFAGLRSFRYGGGDILIKAPIPCFVSLAFKLWGRAGGAVADIPGIKAALSDFVNSSAFPGRLFASDLIGVLRDTVSSGLQTLEIDMAGEILYPDGALLRLRSDEVLTIPSDYERMVTGRTTVFYLDPEDIEISEETLSQPEIL